MKPILEVHDLNYTYSIGTPFEHKALDGVSFAVNRGEFIGVIGHTGSGKSTLMQQLNGLLRPTSGTVLLDGEDIWRDKMATKAARFRVGLVFQYPEYQLFEETVYKDISFGPKNMGLTGDELDARVREAAGFVGITEEQLFMSPFDLSGGQKRRVAIAGVIAMNPEVLILDEPTAGLDPSGRAEILSNIDSYRKSKNATILMVSHSMSDVAQMTARLMVMYRSKLVMDGTPEEVFSHAGELVEMGLDIPAVTRIFLKMQERGVDVKPVYTVEQAAAEILRLKGGAPNA